MTTMLNMRILIGITCGATDPKHWLAAAKQEPALRSKPRGCKECPLRIGGEWETGAAAALAKMSDHQRSTMRRRWACHEREAVRPCAGMVRLATPKERP